MVPTARTGCLACDLFSGAQPLPGGRLHETLYWVVEHTIGPLGVGTLVVKPIRHVVHLADLYEAEAAELGPVLRRTAAAVTEMFQPEQVYTCLWSHAEAIPGHIHFVVQPITRSHMRRFNAFGPALQAAMLRDGMSPDPKYVGIICEQFRSIFIRNELDIP